MSSLSLKNLSYLYDGQKVIENLDFETEIINPNENNTVFYDRLYQDIFVPVLEHILKINELSLKKR